MSGSAHTWRIDLSEQIMPDSEVMLNLTVTKFGSPSVTLGYELAVEG